MKDKKRRSAAAIRGAPQYKPETSAKTIRVIIGPTLRARREGHQVFLRGQVTMTAITSKARQRNRMTRSAGGMRVSVNPSIDIRTT
jgi:hypothetical protein